MGGKNSEDLLCPSFRGGGGFWTTPGDSQRYSWLCIQKSSWRVQGDPMGFWESNAGWSCASKCPTHCVIARTPLCPSFISSPFFSFSSEISYFTYITFTKGNLLSTCFVPPVPIICAYQVYQLDIGISLTFILEYLKMTIRK